MSPGTGTFLRFLLRRERRGLVLWIAGITAMVLIQSVQSQSFYTTERDLAVLRATGAGNPAFTAMTGPLELVDTIGGEVVFEIYAWAALITGLMAMFLVGRNTRADEEQGRAELLRSGPVGRHALTQGALALAALAALAVAVTTSIATVATGLPLTGSVLLGASLGGFGVVIAAATVLAAQIYESARAVYASVGAVIGVAFALRAVGDSLDGTGALSWLSPMGWGQQALPFVENRWWTLLLPPLAAVALLAVGFGLLERRDLGAGLVAPSPGRPGASAALSSPLGLAWRLQRPSFTGWMIGTFVAGATFGSLAPSMEQFIADNPDLADMLPGGAGSVVESFLSLALSLVALLAAAAGGAAVLRARTEETSGRAELVLGTAVSQVRWFGAHLTMGVAAAVVAALLGGFGAGAAFDLIGSDGLRSVDLPLEALVWVPSILVVVGLAAAAAGLVPRFAGAVTWTVVTLAGVVMFFGDSFELPTWLKALSPLYHSPQAPLEGPAVRPLVVLALVAVVLMATGSVAIARRDLDLR